MNCRQFDFNLFLGMEKILADAINSKVSSPSELYEIFRNRLSDEYGLDNVTNEQLREYFKNSLIESELVDSAIKYNGNKPEDEKQEKTEFSDQYKEEKKKDLGIIDLKAFEVKTIHKYKSVNSINELYNKYFSGSLLSYNRFKQEFSREIFSRSLVSFDANNAYIIRSNEDVNDNILAYKIDLELELYNFLVDKGVVFDENEDVVSKFEEMGYTNKDAFESELSDDNSLAEAYYAFVGLSHFDSIVKMFSTIVKKDGGKYSLVVEHKIKNNFSDNPIDMISEVSKITKAMIEYTPILDKNGEPLKGKYLKLSEVTSVIGKLKNVVGLNSDLSDEIRNNPEENIAKIMRQYLTNPKDFEGQFNNNDINIIRTIYNYFYKNPDEDIAIDSQMNRSTVSLYQIKNDEYKKDGCTHYNIIADAVTTTIDKTISQKYVTIKETTDGVLRQMTRDITVNKYMDQLKKDFNARANNSLDLSNGNLPSVIGNSNIELDDGLFKIDIPGIKTIVINASISFSKGFLKNMPIESKIKPSDVSSYLKGEKLTSQSKTNYLNIIKFIQDITGARFLDNNGELLLSLQSKGKRFIEEGLYNSCRILYYQSISSEYNNNKTEDQNLKLKDFMHEKGYKVSDDLVYGNRLTPFNNITTVEFFKQVSKAMAIVKGDTSSSISRNLNGDGLPNTSLLNLIGDYRTVFSQLKKSKEEDALSSNFFVYNDNYKIIKDVVYRSDIETEDGTIKNVKKFNAGEIMYQAIFSDFWGNAYNPDGKNGEVMLEPTVFADKSGQPMNVIDMSAPITYHYINGDETFVVENKTLFELSNIPSQLGLKSKLDDLHFYTMKSQYGKLYNKLMSDYKFFISNMINDNENEIDGVKVSELVGKTISDIDNLTLEDVQNILNLGLKFDNYRKSYNEDGSIKEERDVQSEVHSYYGQLNGYILKKFKEYKIIEDKHNYYKRRMNQEDKKFGVSFKKLNPDIVVLNDRGEFKDEFLHIVKSYLVNVEGLSESQINKKPGSKDYKFSATDTDGIGLNEFKKKWVNDDGTLKVSDNDDELVKENIYKSDIVIELNPLLQVMQTANRALMGNYNLAMVGGPHAHKMKTSKKNILEMFDPDLKNKKYEKNKNKYILDDLMKSGLTKDEALQMLWEESEESARTIAMHKRMVAYQAKMHPFTQGLITGVTRNMKMMVMDDVKQKVWNTIGVEEGFDVADGSGWVSMVASLLFRNSMGDMGTDSISIKAIRHAIDPDTMAAHLDKYAIQALSNEVLRQSLISKKPWANLNKIMLDSVKFKNVFPGEIGNIFSSKYSINDELEVYPSIPAVENDQELIPSIENYVTMPTGLRGRAIRYSIEGTGVLTTLEGIAYDENTDTYIILNSFESTLGNGFTTEPGYTMIDETRGFKRVKLESLYDIWEKVLGGMYSVSENDDSTQLTVNGKSYSYSDDSNEALAQFMNDIVIKKDENVINRLNDMGIETSEMDETIDGISQTNYYQPLKEALIWQINNSSGMKNGAKNVNSNKILSEGSENPDYFITDSLHYGVQGNFDHKFSEEHEARVTEASQVISAAETNGYMSNDVKRLYKALGSVIRYSTLDETQALIDKDGSISELLAKKMIQIMSTKDRLGLAQAWGKKVKDIWDEKKRENPDFPYSEQEFKIAFSDPNFFGALISTISGAFNDSVIRRDMPGLACVLSQAYDAITVVDGENGVELPNIKFKSFVSELTNKARAAVNNAKSENEKQEILINMNTRISEYKKALNSANYGSNANSVTISSEEVSSYDKLRLTDGTNNIDFEINSIKEYYDVKDGNYDFILKNNKGVLKGDIVLQRLTGVPRNLKSSRLEFETTIDGTKVVLNEMDLDGSRALYELNNFKNNKPVTKYIKDLILRVAEERNIPITEEDGILDFDYNLLRTELIIHQQYEFAELQNGIINYKGKQHSGISRVRAGEVILPNYNMHKFGISEGMSLSDVNRDFFFSKFEKYKNAPNKKADFYFIDKNGNHLNLVSNIKLTKNDVVEPILFEKENIGGTEYYVDENGTAMFEAIEGCELFKINGELIMTYNGDYEVVNRLNSSNYYVGVGYNFNSSNIDQIVKYIEKYDCKSNKYLYDEDGNLRSKKDSVILYKADADSRYNKYIDNVMASWETQLKMIGVRIPAQSLQSVMAMKIVGFTEKNVNRAYVPIKKNWLDGSDFDIDKIYMSGFSVNRNGELQTHTPFFNFKYISKSFELPYPDGISKKGVNAPIVVDGRIYDVDAINRYANAYFDSNLAYSEYDYSEFVDFLNEMVGRSVYPGKGLNNNAATLIDSYFQSKITDKNRLIDASKNTAISALYKISNSSVNMLSSNRGVDMDGPKAGAAKSPKAWDAMQMSMDNYATLPLMKEENGAGRNVIGIAAVGIKDFYALSHIYNQNIIKIENKYKNRLSKYEDIEFSKLKEVDPELANEIYDDMYELANPKLINLVGNDGSSNKVVTTFVANTNLYDKPLLNEVYDSIIEDSKIKYGTNMVLDVRRMDDVSLALSALLSSATDNAKELDLSKINAGPELAGTYIYMLIQGIQFDDITDFMVSPTVDAIVAKSKSNIFLNKKSRIDSAVSYFLDGIKYRNFLSRDQYDTLKYHLSKTKQLKNELYSLLPESDMFRFNDEKGNKKSVFSDFDLYIKLITDNNKIDDFINIVYENFPNRNGVFTSFYDKISNDFQNENDAYTEKHAYSNLPLKRFLKAIKQRAEDLKEVSVSQIEEFKKIYDESEEITMLGRRLGINGGMGTDLYSQYSFNQNFNNYFANRLKEAVLTDEDIFVKYKEITGEAGISNLENFTDMRNFHKTIDRNDKAELVKHLKYQEIVIKLYDLIKSKFNIVEIEMFAPHYSAMLDSQNLAMNMFSDTSTIYNYSLRIMNELYNSGYTPSDNFVKTKFNEDEVKKISNFILADLVNKFMNNNDIEFIVTKGNYYYDENLVYKKAEEDVNMNLNTVNGRISFKLFMDKNKDLFKLISSKTDGNAFLDNLITDTKKDPLTSEDYEFIKLDLDMNNIKNDVDQLQFQEMSNGFRALKRSGFSVLPGRSVADAFFIYNLIVNNNSFGKTAFTKIFENDLQVNEDNIISDFFKFTGDIDYSKFTDTGDLYNMNLDYDYISKAIAKKKTKYDSLTRFDGKYIKMWNNDNKKYDFYEYIVTDEHTGKGRYKRVENDDFKTNIPSFMYMINQNHEIEIKDNFNTNKAVKSSILYKFVDEIKNGNIKIAVKC